MTKIVIDAFFHMMPGHRLSRNIFVGGYVCNYGRYSPYDLYHPNGASMLFSDLAAEYDIKYSNQPYSEVSLCDADILIIPNPDYPVYEGASPYRIDEPDRVALMNFLGRGGSVLLLINSFYAKSDFWEENFDIERINPFLEMLGIQWDSNYMSDDNRILPAISENYCVGYGQGGRVKNAALPSDAVSLLRFEDCEFGFVKKVGAGKIAVIGDAGLISNGLYGFPTFDNKAFLLKLIHSLKPDFAVKAPEKFEKICYGNVSCAPSKDGITEELFKTLQSDAVYSIDHHYRHLLWETKGESVTVKEAAAELPFLLGSLEGEKSVSVPVSFIPVQEGKATKTITMELNVIATRKDGVTEYLVTGNCFTENLEWDEVGADVELFSAIGKLLRVNTVLQIELSVNASGMLKYAAIKQGQILYDYNTRNIHYGYDILLNSNCTILSPSAK